MLNRYARTVRAFRLRYSKRDRNLFRMRQHAEQDRAVLTRTDRRLIRFRDLKLKPGGSSRIHYNPAWRMSVAAFRARQRIRRLVAAMFPPA